MDPVEELRYLVLAAQRDGNRALAALLRPLALTPAQAEVINVLARAERPLTVREVGDHLVCEPGSPSRLVASLAEAGLVARSVDPRDARAWTLELSESGRQAAEAVRAVDARLHDELRAGLTSQSDIEAALRVLRQLAPDGASAAALGRRLAAEAARPSSRS
ncbi:MarR family transcriptional regulator [Solirubrobacter ginsenosidimutans]|uniref:MarR family transcriptional regulator n=1 Tax=Solirubrobacter ginsenosidimutans TaxID=490573 RepID=A0A9X3MX88_9ACTN|nr:MarR family transcriptional regulator [Solirubrobacter ginsenosidimutans]MDA0164389.1 MarR family transcriptional regulator [Solirubrobacter ginsenosidimutans]